VEASREKKTAQAKLDATVGEWGGDKTLGRKTITGMAGLGVENNRAKEGKGLSKSNK